jgi:hypothetical protein
MIEYEERMEIIQQMLYWAYSRGIEDIKKLSVIYISKGYPAEDILILEKAARNLYFKYLL